MEAVFKSCYDEEEKLRLQWLKSKDGRRFLFNKAEAYPCGCGGGCDGVCKAWMYTGEVWCFDVDNNVYEVDGDMTKSIGTVHHWSLSNASQLENTQKLLEQQKIITAKASNISNETRLQMNRARIDLEAAQKIFDDLVTVMSSYEKDETKETTSLKNLQSEIDDMKAYRQKERDETKRRLKAALDDIEADELKYE
jgi:hypothetical protein